MSSAISSRLVFALRFCTCRSAGRGELLTMGCAAPRNTNTHAGFPSSLIVIYSSAATRARARTHVWDTLDAISQSVTHDGVSHAVEIDVGSRREWLPDSYQEAEWPAATLLLRRRLKEGMRFQLREWVVRMGRGGGI